MGTTAVTSIVHVCTDFWPSMGGIQEFVRELATRSAATGLHVSVLCLNRSKDIREQLAARERLDGVAIRRVPFIDLKYYKPAAYPFAMLKSHDLIHLHGIGAHLDFIGYFKWLHQRPIVLSTHGGIFHTENLAGIKNIYFHRLIPRVLRHVDVVAACSSSDAALFARVTGRVTLIENAIDVRPYLELSVAEKLRNRVLYVGRLAENKGVGNLLRAAAFARSAGANFDLRLVGPDADNTRPAFEALARELGLADCVTFTGRVDQEQLIKEYAQAAVCVSASRYEGFGLSALEAKAAGCRLLLNANEAFRSIFGTDPVAILVDFENTEAAGAALIDLLSRAKQPPSQASRREVLAYSWERKTADWLELYSETIRRATPIGRSGHKMA